MAKETPGLDRALSAFLAKAAASKACSFKEISDYHVHPAATVSNAEANEAIDDADRFVERIASLLNTS